MVREIFPASLIVLFGVLAASVSNADTSILPKGVRALVYRHSEAAVPGYYGPNGLWESHAVQERIGLDVVESLSKDAGALIRDLKRSSPEVFEKVELGSIDLNPTINVKADALALAWGVADNTMLGAALPMMKAHVTFSGGFQGSNSIRTAEGTLRAYASDPARTDRTTLSALAQVMAGLPTLQGEHIQDLLVNYYGYQPIGEWTASGIGDAMLFGQYRFHDSYDIKQAVKLSVDLPTGRPDDPDNLMDVPFGKGYVASTAELLNDIYVGGSDRLIIAFNGKYQYNWPTQQQRRLPESRSFPLSREKELVTWKAGDIWALASEADVRLFAQLRSFLSFSFVGKGEDVYSGSKPGYDYGILSQGSQTLNQVVTAGLHYSTVQHYLDQSFPVPFKVGVNYSQVVGGLNAEQVRMATFQGEFYF